MLSVIIPSYRDPYLQNTIDSLLENATGELEIIVVLDGYWPDPPLKQDPRMRQIHKGKNGGMREAINSGVAIARGKWIMRTDEHCMFSKGFDTILERDCKSDWIMTPRRYFLDVKKWKVMDDPYIDYEKLVIQTVKGVKKWTGYPWESRQKERAHKKVDQTMAMQGSCWFMHKQWWDDVIGELQTKGYGPHLQDSHEMVFKTWQAGGKLMVNKNIWFAHKHVSFTRTHRYGNTDFTPCLEYSFNTWEKYYREHIRRKWKI